MKRFYGIAFLLALVMVPGIQAQDQHPDLSGLWSYVIALPRDGLKKTAPGGVVVNKLDTGIVAGRREVPGALPSTKAPVYKPEFLAKVKDLYDHESKTDPAFYCGKPGVPRIGPPRKILQLKNETIFFYEDVSGDPYRIVRTDGSPHRADANPSAYGDSIGHWEGNTFVVDVTGFEDTTWFGEGGYFHTEAMHVVERFWRDGENLAYQVTVEDPQVLTGPWTMPVRVVKPSAEPLEESPACKEDDANRLVNNDHHLQR